MFIDVEGIPVSKGRSIKLLSDSESIMPEKIKQETKLIEMIVGVNEENVENVFAHINEDNVKKACKIISFAAEIRPLKIESFLILSSLISSKFGVGIQQETSHCQSLTAQDGLPVFCYNEIYNKAYIEFAAGSIEQAIKEDDVERFCELLSEPTFNADDEVKAIKWCFYEIADNSLLDSCKSYMRLIAFFGAVKCFKQAIMNDTFSLNGISVYAIAGGSNEIVRLLEQKGESFDDCFEVAVEYHRMDLCDWLLTNRTKHESFDLSRSLKYFNYPAFFFKMINEKVFGDALHIAAEECNINIVKYLIEQCHVDVNVKYRYISGFGYEYIKRTPLHTATEKCCTDIIKYLIEQCHANVEAKNEYGLTPLHIALENSHIKIIKYLIDQSHTNVEAEVEDYMTLLHIASQKGQLEVVKCLIEQCHANVEAEGKDGMTPLYYASKNGHIEVVKYLIEQCHANVEAKDKNGKTPLHYHSEKCQIKAVRYLIEQCHANVEAKDNDGKTPLHIASEKGHIEIVEYLIEQCQANVEAKNNIGQTPLHFASYNSQLEVVKYLIEQGHANVDAKGYLEMTPLHFAAENCNFEVAKYLIENGRADLKAKDSRGWTPIQWFAYYNHFEVVRYILLEVKQ
jgi:ankyrin repeat protein